MEQADRLDPHGPYIGRGEYGDIALYNPAGASLVMNEWGPEARRAVRAVRRYCGGPMRIRVLVEWKRSGGRDVTDMCDVYGWRAALVAARAMREEMGAESRPTTCVYDARLQDFFEDL